MRQGGILKITKKVIDALPFPSAGQVFYRDEFMPGFGLRVTPRKKVFILEKKVQGQVRRLTLGHYGPLTLEDGRNKALEKMAAIGQGKTWDEIDQPKGPTFGDLIAAYKERHIPRKKSGFKDEAYLKNHLDAWKKRRLSSIRRKDTALLHGNIGRENGPYAANRLLALLRKMFNLAKVWGLHEGENPAMGIEMFPEESRERFIQPEELPKFMEALKSEDNPFVRAAFFTMLLTGQRRGEVLSMRWEDLNLDQGVWRIPETKAGRSHLVPLPLPIINLLRGFPRELNNPFVFCGHKKGTHLVSIAKNFNAIKEKAGLGDIRPHDLRRTVGSWLAGSGQSLPIIGKILGHTQPQTTAIYARLNLDPVRTALDANAQRMLAIGQGKEEHGDNEKSKT